jgi:hypothetical protein
MFRNYGCRERSSDITIIKAIRATWASPGLFTPVFDGSKAFQEEFHGGDCAFSNPTREVMKETYAHFGGTRRVTSLISLGCNMPRSTGFIRALDHRLAAVTFFSDSELVAIQLNDQLGKTEIYHRYAIQATQDSPYSLQTKDVARIVSQTETYLLTQKDKLEECLVETTRYTIGDICKPCCLKPFYQSLIRCADGSPTTLLAEQATFPPLSFYFLEREDVKESMEKAFLALDHSHVKIMVVLGMSGSGKTQSVVNFMKAHVETYVNKTCLKLNWC